MDVILFYLNIFLCIIIQKFPFNMFEKQNNTFRNQKYQVIIYKTQFW